MNCWLKHGSRVGLLLVLVFIISFAWYWLHPVNQTLQMQILEIYYYGFSGMNFPSFALGAIQSYVWGFVFVGLWCLVGCKGKKD